ncbi:unnamed protein product [Pleuronectes platessa]|uniref:CSD domain-containing protein n=1 Tax=Pleuronectes platessa TaxID=8262 RepID=A0A9N7UY92_PLEPL|nr:unnamed protein product [Pleuronectes platessa]
MRAELVTAGIEDVGLMVTAAARLHRGSFSNATWAQRVRGETWPKDHSTTRPGVMAGTVAHRKPSRGPGRGGGEEPAAEQEDRPRPHVLSGTGFCKWFNVRMGFGFISLTSSDGSPVDPPLDVFVHQSKLVMEGFRSLKEGEQVEFTYKKSSKGLESLRVTGPGGGPCSGSERRPKGKVPLPKRKPKVDR